MFKGKHRLGCAGLRVAVVFQFISSLRELICGPQEDISSVIGLGLRPGLESLFCGSDSFLDVSFVGRRGFVEGLLVKRGDNVESRGQLDFLAVEP